MTAEKSVKPDPFRLVSSRWKKWTSSIQLTFWCLVLAMLVPQSSLSQDVYFSIPEEQPVGVFIGSIGMALDQDGNSSASSSMHYTYTISSGENSDHFRIDPSSGDIRTRSILDRETLCPRLDTCSLEFEVNKQSGNGFQTVSVVVHLRDINDNSPMFSQSQFTVTVPENAPVGERISLPEAIDLDTAPQNSVQSYSLSPSNGGLFHLLEESGLYLVVSGNLDHEIISQYNLVVTAEDGPHQGSMNITVLVEDVNDNPPMFTRGRYAVQLSTTAASHFLVVTVNAADRDEGRNAILHYRLAATQQSSSIAQQFQVDSNTGELFTVQSLSAGQHIVVVEAVDGGTPPLVSQTVVEVNVFDPENTRPEISLTVLGGHPWAVIDEHASPGTVVAHVAVNDFDQGTNGQVTCSFSSHEFNLQAIAPGEYLVMLVSMLDREQQASYNVTITCEDSGLPPLTNSQTFYIRVRDVNDNAPVLTFGNDVNLSVYENNNIGTIITTIQATDADEGENAELTFSLLDDIDETFQIAGPGSNVLFCNKVLDRERTASYVVRVLAQDHGHPPLSTVATLRVSVLDVNDNAPQFSAPVFNFTLYENSLAGTLIGQVTAFDNDVGKNSRIRYSILSPTNQSNFQISYDGTLISSAIFDRESVAVHRLLIAAVDGGTPAMTSTVQVEVKVMDVNDNSPVFAFPTQDSLVTLTLPVENSQVVAVMQVYDVDEGRNAAIRFSLVSQSPALFQLDAFSGQLFTARSLTTQDVGVHNLTINAMDGGTPPMISTAMLTVIVSGN